MKYKRRLPVIPWGAATHTAIVSVRDFLLLFLLFSLLFCILVWIVAVGPFCWMLRDGLGPDSVQSHGPHAVARFLGTFYWGPVLVALVALVPPCLWLVRKVISVEAVSPGVLEQPPG